MLATSVLAACSSSTEDGRAQVVVTSNILGDVVEQVVGDAGDVEVLLPLGADPHEFSASVRQAEDMAEADLLVIDGGGFEAGLDDAVDAAADAGATVFAFTDHTEIEGGDPHIWSDPTKLAAGVVALAGALVDAGFDASVEERAAAYADALNALDAEIRSTLSDIPPERRKLVTNHEVLGYFAARYDFDVIGTVIPSITTGAAVSAADIDALADTIANAGVPAVFGETSSPADVAEALADSLGGDVRVVELYTESLGGAGSGAENYLAMMRTNARLIHDALVP